ncbi:MAG: MFS transporter [Chloroflexota bacterium]
MSVRAEIVISDEEATTTPPPSLWRNRDYMLLWSGQMVSQLGSGVSQIAYPLLILALTHSPAKAGFAAALYSIPYLIFSLPAGALIDRWNRKRVMILCDAGRAIALGSIPLAYALGHLTLAQLYVTAATEGTLFVFFNIAEVACLPRVVPGPQIPTAAAQNEGGGIATMLIAPPLGGILFAVARSIPFLVDAISYSASVVSLSLMKATFQGDRTAERRKLRVEIMEGVSWLWNQKLIRFMALLTGGLNLIFSGSFLCVVVLAQRQGASAPTIGLIFSIASIGGLLGALLAPRIQRRFGFGQVIVATVVGQVLVFPLLAIAPNSVLLGITLGAMFVTSPIYNSVQFGYRLQIIPDELQGRVNSAFRLVAFGFQPLGAALSGVLIGAFGAKEAVLVFACVGLGLAVLTVGNSQVRNARPVVEESLAR